MSQPLRVLWTLMPLVAPRPWMPCSSCGEPKPFRSSEKIRLNANGKRLDAWLIYRCVDCEATWNRPLFERRSVRSLDAALLQAASESDPDFVRRHAFDVDALARHAKRVETFPEVAVRRTVTAGAGPGAVVLEIVFAVELPATPRLDRMLAGELGLSRSRLAALHDRGRISVEPVRKDALRRPPSDGMRIAFDLSAEPDAAALMRAAAGLAG
ncbi:DUF1062 domain-containing protein [Pseudomonas sp. R2.Fl]|nr:DUF1062 domain-containing protein [Pseudomonas sp. R2.Fl]